MHNNFIPYLMLSSSPKRPSLCQTQRGPGEGDFFQSIFTFKKIESIKFILICYEYIKNNSYINFGDWIHIRIAWPCSNAVKTHNVKYIQLNFGNWSSSCQNFNQVQQQLLGGKWRRKREKANWYWAF